MEEDRRRSTGNNQKIDEQFRAKLDLRQEFSPTKQRPIEQYFTARPQEPPRPPPFLRKPPIYAQPLPPLPPPPPRHQPPPRRPQTTSPERRPSSKGREDPPTLFINKNHR